MGPEHSPRISTPNLEDMDVSPTSDPTIEVELIMDRETNQEVVLDERDAYDKDNEVDGGSLNGNRDDERSSMISKEGNDVNEEGLEEQFIELLLWEEESERYLKQLDAEEVELRKAVDRNVNENHANRILESSLAAKIGAQRQAREQMEVESLQERNKEIRKEYQRVNQKADSVRMATLRRSTKMMAIHVDGTNQFQNRFKKYRSPKAVVNAINTKKVQILQVKAQVQTDMDKLDKINADVSKLQARRETFKVYQEVVMESKVLAKQGAMKQSVGNFF